MRQGAAWAIIVLLSFAACEGDAFSADLGPAHSRIEITVEGPQNAPVVGAAVGVSVYGGEICKGGELIGAVEATTDARGQASMLVEAAPEASQSVNCVQVLIEPPSGSDLQGVDVSFGRIYLASETYVPEPPLVRYFVMLQASILGPQLNQGR